MNNNVHKQQSFLKKGGENVKVYFGFYCNSL